MKSFLKCAIVIVFVSMLIINGGCTTKRAGHTNVELFPLFRVEETITELPNDMVRKNSSGHVLILINWENDEVINKSKLGSASCK